MSILLRDLLVSNRYGIKTLYYSNTRDGRDDDLQDHSEVKVLRPEAEPETTQMTQEEFDAMMNADEEECDSCTL